MKAAVLAGYRASWADTDAVGGHYPINVSDPRLASHMAGEELKQVQKFLFSLWIQHEYLPGAPTDTSRAIVKELSDTAAVAVVSDCDYDGSVLVDGRTNKVVKPAGTHRDLVNAKLEVVDGVWKVTVFSNVSAGCTVAS